MRGRPRAPDQDQVRGPERRTPGTQTHTGGANRYESRSVGFVCASLVIVLGVGALFGFLAAKGHSSFKPPGAGGRAVAVHVASATCVASAAPIATAVAVTPRWPAPRCADDDDAARRARASCPARPWEAGIVEA